LLINGSVVAQVLANHWPKAAVKLTAEGSSLPCGFYFRLGPPTLYETSREVSLRIADTHTNVLGPAVLFTPYDIVINTLMQAQAALHGVQKESALVNGVQTRSIETDWVRRQVLAPIIQALRTAKQIPNSLQLELSDSIRLPHQRTHDPVIDIILPVFQGLQETLICIRSVLDHTKQDYQLIVINDGSPDPALTKMLQGWAGAGAFTLLENPKNLGFVATVNHGMRQHPNRDVVLLNSDTIVTTGWLERLQVAAMSASNIATATPLSNNATLLSFPIPCEENPMPNTQDLSQLAQQCAMINDGLVMDIPTAVGFCMYIKREALDEIGDFDESSFGQGYAEENDFCLRASALGWRHIAACDVFVAHHGAKSFKDQKPKLIARNLQTLNTRYPDYATTIERFIAQDSLRLARNGLIKSLLRAHADGYILFVMHDLGGGVKTHADDLAKRLQSTGTEVLALSTNIQGVWTITAYGLPYILSYQGDSAFGNALADLKSLVIWHIHYHHILHFPHFIWTLPEHLGVEYDVTLHDYHAICPTINMIDETGQYCGDSQFDSANCNRCLRLNNMEDTNPGLGLSRQFETLNGNMTEWRGFYEKRLKNARRVFSPSQSTADIFLQHFGLANLLVQPHPENAVQITPSLQSSKAPYRIAIIGAIGLHKGYSLLVNCAKSALKNGLPLEFIIFGYTRDDLALNALENVSLTGAYTPEELPEKIADSGCQIAAFLSVWPETFAYTLSEAWRSGLYPVVFDLGALAERIRETGYGTLMPLTQDAKQINAALMDAAERLHRLEHTEFLLGRDYPDVLQDYYGFDVEATRLVQSTVSK
jgi:GT2 family glycosyltransferase/glycosyltransferase involved in cell wall biosynthesis